MFIQTNSSAMQALRYNQMNTIKLHKVMEQLSTGLRINRAADDAAGLAISQSMRFQINGYKQANRNIADGISLIQTAEGALSSVQAIIQRMGVLANQASTGTYNDQDRAKMAIEFEQLKEEIMSIKTHSKFNHIPLLDGQYSFAQSGGLVIQAGYEANDTIKIDMPNLNLIIPALEQLNISTSASASQVMASLKQMVDDVSFMRAKLGATQNRLEHRTNYISNTIENLSASVSRIQDTDYALAMTEFIKSKMLLEASTAMLAQANTLPQMLLKLLENLPRKRI